MNSSLSEISTTPDSPQRQSAPTTQDPRIGEAPAPAPSAVPFKSQLIAEAHRHAQRAKLDWRELFSEKRRTPIARCAVPFEFLATWYFAKVVQLSPDRFSLSVTLQATDEPVCHADINIALELTHAPA